MNILFLAPFGIRPKGTVIARMLPLAAALQRRGVLVTIVAPPYTNPEDSGKEESIRNVRLLNIVLSSAWKPVATLVMAWRMFRLALSQKPCLVHLFKPKGYGGLSAMLMLFLRKTGISLPPVLVDTDDWEGSGGMNELHDYSRLERTIYAFQEQWLLKHSAAATVASLGLEQLVKERYPDKRRLYIPNAADEMEPGIRSKGREQLGIAADTPVVLLYTRFFEFKQEFLHAVFAGIFEKIPAVRFLVVGAGRGDEERQLMDASKKYGFSEALVMAGWIKPERLSNLLAAADVAIYPFSDTLINRCKCPAKLTELLLTGIPVVANNIGQIPEYLIHNKGGIICRPEDVTAMVEGVVTLLAQHDVRLEMGAFNRRHICENYNWDSMAAKLEALYSEINQQQKG